jgi:hypothetical protein
MTNQEIDYALALAIGYPADRVRYWPLDSSLAFVQVWNSSLRGDGPMPFGGWQRFNHTDPAVIWPVAERFDCFPRQSSLSEPDWWTVLKDGACADSNCAATATALAVIRHCKKGQP